MRMLHITPCALEAVYQMLASIPPLSKLSLPHAESVEFVVMRAVDRFGDYIQTPYGHRIRISSKKVGSLITLEQTMAHEMIHMHQAQRGLRLDHGAEFRKLATRVCKTMDWDERAFG